jgi:hypothetical protein
MRPYAISRFQDFRNQSQLISRPKEVHEEEEEEEVHHESVKITKKTKEPERDATTRNEIDILKTCFENAAKTKLL